jgi:hypothetical protein
MVMAQEEFRVLLAAFWLDGHKAAQFVVAEQGPMSAGEVVPVMGSQVRRGLSRSAGLAGFKVR